jgi:predicted nucleic acid-binding Zn ribbon protein
MRVHRYNRTSKCVVCGAEFKHNHKHSKYCSVKCNEIKSRPRINRTITLAPIPEHLIIEEKTVRWTSIK